MKRVLFKIPGAKAEDRRIPWGEQHIRTLIGCTYETRLEWTEDGWGPTALICANQITARALNLPDQIWFKTGTVAGPIILINRDRFGTYLDLTDDDVDRWNVKLREFEEPLSEAYVHCNFSNEQEVRHRREKSLNDGLATNDDFSAVLRLQVEIEQRIRERIATKLRHPERMGSNVRLDLRQLLALAGALDAIPIDYVRVIIKLGEMRNVFAHRPGYMITPADVNNLKLVAASCGLDDVRWAFDQSVDETVNMSEEGRDLRMVFMHVLSWLDDEFLDNYDGYCGLDNSASDKGAT